MDKAPESELIDGEDFARRWEKARTAAFRRLPAPVSPGTGSSEGSSGDSETCMLARCFSGRPEDPPEAREKIKDLLLRGVFDNSRRLGLSLSRHLGLTFEVGDFPALLQSSGIACFQGRWSARENALSLSRAGCSSCTEVGWHACDYWREALDGLVVGLGDKERLARHACIRRGDGECLDVLFSESAAGRGDPQAWGPVPDHMALELLETAEYFRRQTGTAVDLKGMNEGVLHFEFRSATDGRCGGGKAALDRFSELVRERFPGIALKDATPQAVLGEQAGPG